MSQCDSDKKLCGLCLRDMGVCGTESQAKEIAFLESQVGRTWCVQGSERTRLAGAEKDKREERIRKRTHVRSGRTLYAM